MRKQSERNGYSQEQGTRRSVEKGRTSMKTLKKKSVGKMRVTISEACEDNLFMTDSIWLLEKWGTGIFLTARSLLQN